MLAHILLVILLFLKLGMEKSKAIKAGNVDRQKAAMDTNAWPLAVQKISNNIKNQFETPVLFYVLSIIFYIISGADALVLTLALIYLVSRCFHAYVHIGSNFVPWRFRSFLLGMLVLLVMVGIASYRVMALTISL